MKPYVTLIILALICNTSCITNSTAQQSAVQYDKPFDKVPDRRDATIYQVNIRTFSKEGNFKGVTARLDSIKALGINVVYLMPVYPIGIFKSSDSPYCIKDYNTVNSKFGTLTDLQNLIAAAHSKGMAVILDWVANHTSYDHAWLSNKSWYQQDSVGNVISPKGWSDVAQLNFKNNDMRKAMIKSMKYWVYTVNCDGFRCDYADGPPVDFWKEAIDTLRNIKTHKLLMLAEGARATNYEAGFDYNFGFKFFENLELIYKKNKSVLSIDSLNNSDYTATVEGQQIVRYTTNHDVNSSDGTPQELFGGNRGAMTAFVVAAYMKSIPMIYNGQEVGTPYRLKYPFNNTKIDWALNPETVAEYKKIIAFRNNSAAIRRGALVSYSNTNVCVFSKTLGSESILVVCNLRETPVNYTFPSELVNSSWKNAFNGVIVNLSSALTLPPYSYLVLKKQKGF